jgi:diketogulonate reductase-like aldo/keto reductase
MAASNYITLNDGQQTPRIAYGSGTAWFQATGPDGVSSELVEATSTAISIGFTHLDAAKVYGNERSTGVAISKCGLPREKLFITTKVCHPLAHLPKRLVAERDF